MTVIKSIQIFDQAAKSDFGPIVDRQTIRVLPQRRSLHAIIEGPKPGCVKFVLNGKPSVERIAPYIYGGDDFDKALDKAAQYTLVVSVHEDKDGRSAPLACVTVVFSVAPGALVPNLCDFGVSTQMNQKAKDKADTPAPIEIAAPALKALGVKSLRNMIWLSSWADVPGKGAAGSFQLFKDAGFEITATVTCVEVPKSTSVVAGAMERIHDEYGGVVSHFAIGNEPNLKKYFAGSLQEYVDLVLIPASKVLRRRKARVWGPAISENLQSLRDLVKLGMANHIDEACFHPYQRTGEKHEQVLGQAKEIVGVMPLNATEWNIHADNATKWAADFPRIHRAASQYLKRAFFYRSTVRPDRPAGKHALFKTDWTPNEPYYSKFLHPGAP